MWHLPWLFPQTPRSEFCRSTNQTEQLLKPTTRNVDWIRHKAQPVMWYSDWTSIVGIDKSVTLHAMASLIQKALHRQFLSSFFMPRRFHVYARNHASDHSRPASSSTEPIVETFSGPSQQREKPFIRRYRTSRSSPSDPHTKIYSEPARLQPYYVKHPPFRDLPKQKVIKRILV